MDRTDVHLRQTPVTAERLPAKPMHPILEFRRGFFSKGERDDVRRGNPALSLLKDFDDSGGNDLGLSGAGAGNDLQVVVDRPYCLLLGRRILHAVLLACALRELIDLLWL